MEEAIDTAILALAQRHRGYVTRRELLDLGLSRHGINHRLRLGRLLPVYAGVYAVGHEPARAEDRAFGALLACGARSLLSHGSGVAHWGVSKWRLPFEVTAPSAHRRPGIRVHRARTLTRRDVRVHRGIRVTSPARTLLDVARRFNDKQLARAVNELRLAGHLRLPDLGELLHRCPRHPGARRLRPFVERPTGPTRSEFEDAFVAFTERYGLPTPRINVRIAGREVDAFFPDERLIVELDGYEFHSSRESFRENRERDAAMLALGLVTVRITWDRLHGTPDTEAARLGEILQGRRG